MAAEDRLRDVKRLAERRAELSDEFEQTTAALAAAILAAEKAGVPLAQVAREIGLTRQRVGQLRDMATRKRDATGQ